MDEYRNYNPILMVVDGGFFVELEIENKGEDIATINLVDISGMAIQKS